MIPAGILSGVSISEAVIVHQQQRHYAYCRVLRSDCLFSVQLGHLKLSGYGLLSTQAVQNRSQNLFTIFIYLVMIYFI